MRYSIVIHQAEEGGYWVDVPALPGCYSQGDTLDDTLQDATEAIELYVQAVREQGQDLPKDEDVVFQVSIAV